MSKTIGAEKAFIEEMISGRLDPRTTMLRYGLLNDDVGDLVSRADIGMSAAQMLSGMLRARTIVALSEADIDCRTDGALISIDPRYLRLAAAVGRTLVHHLNISGEDLKTLAKNNVTVYGSTAIDYAALAASASNVVASWSLVEGGNLKPPDVLLDSFCGARHVKIYDRYFDQYALDSLEEVLSILPSQAKSTLRLTILVGQEKGGVPSSDIQAMAAQHVDGKNVRVCRSDKPARYKSFLHDRYIQVDESHTFVLAAGVGCFKGSKGKNRACNVFKHDLYVSQVLAEVIAQDNNDIIEIKY